MKSISWLPMPEAATDDVFTISMFNALKNNVKFLQELSEIEHTAGAHDVGKMGGKGAVAYGVYSPTSGLSEVYNVSGISSPSTGRYRFAFSTALPNILYTATTRCSQPYRSIISARTTTYVQVTVYNTADTGVNLTGAEAVSVSVWQRV